MAFRAIVVALLLIACSGPIAMAASSRGACPSGAMNATQYNYGGRTASGQAYRADAATAAHKTLRFGTKVMVTNPATGASVLVTINDRGPFTRGRDIDLSRAAARAIGLRDVGRVCTLIL
ncbi:MAG TPA: septal ring lytic transglycosylase RlpA family protein [Xanthobacteraceae bacterium]